MVDAKHLLGVLLGTGFGGRNPMAGQAFLRPGVGPDMAGESDRPLDMLNTMAGGGMGEGRGVHGGLGRSGAMMALAGVAAKAVQGRDHPPEEDDVPGAYDPYQAERLDARHAETAIRAMFAAVNAEAGGDSAERARLLRGLEQAGATEEERRHVERELAANASLETVVGEVDNAETAEQVYAASIAALSPDSEASRRYLRELRERLDLPEDTIDDLHRDLHMPR